jgi:hypothetical protein
MCQQQLTAKKFTVTGVLLVLQQACLSHYLNIDPTSIWSDKLKKSSAAFNLNNDAPLLLDHLAVHIVAYLKVYREADGKFLEQYGNAAELFNYLLMQQKFMVSNGPSSYILTKPCF